MPKEFRLNHYAFFLSFINLILYQFPFFKFVTSNFEIKSFNGILLIVSLLLAALFLNALVFYIGLYLLRSMGKGIIILFFNLNAIALYFINTYGVIIDKTMISNVFNTNYEEASSFFSSGLFFYLFSLGIVPSIFVFIIKPLTIRFKQFSIHTSLTFALLLLIAFINSPNWLWIDKNAKPLIGLLLPWSYVVNTNRHFYHRYQDNKKQILLPDATVKNNEKSVMVLVIGESARSGNFSLYGYEKNTNPLLSKIENLQHYRAESCATYTTAGTKCILEHKNTSELYETLPNYLYRNQIEVIWRTTNWGAPNLSIQNFQNKEDLRSEYKIEKEVYDEVLIYDLKEKILASNKNKVLVILHSSTSHGPTYYKKYPKEFEKFSPVCKSVELSNCTQEELINAYDNTIIYTDFILNSLIGELKKLEDYKSSMIFISDHGESLGEYSLYMHGIPASIAPKEQLEIPFIVWTSEDSKKTINAAILSQHHVFHSVLDFLDIESPVYDSEMSIFK